MAALTHGELFAGISGFGVGFERAGLPVRWAVEIEGDCRTVIRRHHPEALILNDVREVGAHNLPPVDVISFGSPCQDLSVAGRRKGLDGARSGLFFEATRVIGELHPTYAVWENVPGALSSNAGRDFGAVLDALAECGAVDICWRMLDAQYFGLAQRRLRLFLVASFRAGVSAAQVLFESEGGDGYPPPRREAGEGTAATLTRGTATGRGVRQPGRRREDDVNLVPALAACDTRREGKGPDSDATTTLIPLVGHLARSLRAQGQMAHREDADTLIAFDTTQITSPGNYSMPQPGDPCHPLAAGAHPPAVAFTNRGVAGATRETLLAASHGALPMVAHSLTAEGHDASEDGTGRGTPLIPAYSVAVRGRADGQEWELGEAEIGNALRAGDGGSSRGNWALTPAMAVRRLTPTECERLQGFPDGWTAGHSDSARYRMLGNAVAVPVAEWIGRRIMEAA